MARSNNPPMGSSTDWGHCPCVPSATLGSTHYLFRPHACAVDRARPVDHPWLPNSSSTAWCSRRHEPAGVHSVNRRCAVSTVTPKFGGRCHHAQPLVSTNTIAVNTARTARSSTRDIPPPAGVSSLVGSTVQPVPITHPGTSRRDNSSITAHDRKFTKTKVRYALNLTTRSPATARIC